MMPLTKLKLSEAEVLATTLLNIPPAQVGSTELPEFGGVYLFRNSTDVIIYVGKAINLRRRISVDHLSQELRDTMSAFRRSINRVFGIPFGVEMKTWIYENCKVSFCRIDDPDMRSLVEALVISVTRSQSLLNSNH